MFKYIRHVVALVKQKHHERVLTSRSSRWSVVEREFLKNQPECSACGGRARLNVHHKIPFHVAPEHELEVSNLITLCMGLDTHCHLKLGHGGNFRDYNPEIVDDAREFYRALHREDRQEMDAIAWRAREKRRRG